VCWFALLGGAPGAAPTAGWRLDAVSTPAMLGQYAVRLATGAADFIRRADTRSIDSDAGFGTAFLNVHAKSTSTDLVTAIDRAVERWLVDQIVRDRPGDAVLGEEGGQREGSTGLRWVLDPIDGTVNFVLGLPQFAVSVAAEVDGQAVAGAVCNPASGELFQATLGGGAWLGARRLAGPRDVQLTRAVVGTGFGYDRETRRRQAAVVAQVLPRVGDLRRIGSAALDLCSVACGRLDAYYEVGLNPWDYAAGALIAAEAGCVVQGLRSKPASPRMVTATGRRLAGQFVAMLTEIAADEVAG
jgi:myo-inositol-1(or 4)-monophosphatase